MAHTEERDIRQERNVANSVEETHCVTEQQTTAQETRCSANALNGAAQRPSPSEQLALFPRALTHHLTTYLSSPTSVFNPANKQAKLSEQGTTRVTVDPRDGNSTRSTRSHTPREAVAGSNARTQRLPQRSGRNATDSLRGTTPGIDARQHVQGHGYSELNFGAFDDGEIEELDDSDDTYAHDHGYPELIRGNPHAQRIVELKDTGSNEDLENSNQHGDSEGLGKSCSSISQPAYPSTSLFVDSPVERALAHTGERDNRHETNTQKPVEETRRVRGQHATVQEPKCQPDSSKPIAQKPASLGHSSASTSYTATKRAKQPQGATQAKIDARGNTSARPTRPSAQGKAVAIPSSQIQPKRAEQKYLGTKTTGVGAGQTSTAARRTQTTGTVVTTPSKPNKQLEPEDREVIPARTTRTQTSRTNATVKKAWR
ncbi:hypothetical protein PM082_019791 [Marasmius tenuissimus]|nr:hypothetical protein PM082_019791 [Marasmius tenuissimus]